MACGVRADKTECMALPRAQRALGYMAPHQGRTPMECAGREDSMVSSAAAPMGCLAMEPTMESMEPLAAVMACMERPPAAAATACTAAVTTLPYMARAARMECMGPAAMVSTAAVPESACMATAP